MAHNADISFLLERLIQSSIKTPSKLDIDHWKRSALRTLANSHSTRTNQFEITARLEGLEEKWMINNKDSLAEALHVRRAELSVTSNKWTPEILSLLLELSERPIEHSNPTDLALPKPELPAPLTWADILAEDPLDDQDGVWDNVDFAVDESNDDERTESAHSDHSVLTPESSVVGQAVEACDESLIEPAANISLQVIQNAQWWNSQEDDRLSSICEEDEDRRPRVNPTELQAVREVIFTLLGLPTSVFSQDDEGHISVSESNFLKHASQESLTDQLQGFAVIATKLLSIRRWVEREARTALEEAFQTAIASRLEIVDRALSAIQSKILSCDAQAVKTLLNLYNKTLTISGLLLPVHDTLLELDNTSKSKRPFRILECLFDKTCLRQSIGDAEGYTYMATLFFDCFQTYFRHVRLWMEKGQLIGRDGVFFIKKKEKDVQLNSVWRDQYYLIKDSNGELHAPRFLHLAAKKIFDTGKSVDFLRRLGWESHDLGQLPPEDVTLTYQSICLSPKTDLFSPFAELFDIALNRWIARKHQAFLTELRAQLESHCSLQSSLDALEYIYFANGALNPDVNSKIFEKMDTGKYRWNDGFVMTELFKAALKRIPSDRLQSCPRPATNVAWRSMSALEDIRVLYTLPWPVANVISTNSISVYQRVSIFLTQLQRAKYLLQRQRITKIVQGADRKPVLEFYKLRHHLLWLTNTILTYINDMVLTVATAEMRTAMERADLDSMIAVHHAYISRLEDQCLLLQRHRSIHQAIISLLDLTVLFSDVRASHARRKISSTSEGRFTDAKIEHSGLKEVAEPGSEVEDSDSDSDESGFGSTWHSEAPDVVKLKDMLSTFRNLHCLITAAVKGLSKADSAPCWEMLATYLSMGWE